MSYVSIQTIVSMFTCGKYYVFGDQFVVDDGELRQLDARHPRHGSLASFPVELDVVRGVAICRRRRKACTPRCYHLPKAVTGDQGMRRCGSSNRAVIRGEGKMFEAASKSRTLLRKVTFNGVTSLQEGFVSFWISYFINGLHKHLIRIYLCT